MGNVGSLVIGYVYWLYLQRWFFLQNLVLIDVIDNKPVFILALFAFPFLDTLRVFTIRGISGSSPFLADKNHFHHKLSGGWIFAYTIYYFHNVLLFNYYSLFFFIV